MNTQEMIEAIWSNYPSENYSELREALDHCLTLLKAEAEGRLLVLPFRVGDTVYLIEQATKDVKCIFDARVNGISVSYAGVVNLHFGGYPPLSHCASSIGKTVFLTREEAEEALKKESET